MRAGPPPKKAMPTTPAPPFPKSPNCGRKRPSCSVIPITPPMALKERAGVCDNNLGASLTSGGDEVHAIFAQELGLSCTAHHIEEDFVLDVWCDDARSVATREGLA